MSEGMVLDVIPTGEAVAPVIAQSMPLDILNRQEFVDRVFSLVEVIASQRGSCTFALDGVWGSGKTFVLNMLEPKLQDWQDGDKYLVFHYNCWQYDYYEEPLVAIVSVILDTLRSCNLSKANAIFRTVVETATGIFDGVLQSLQCPEIFKLIKDGIGKAKEAENATHSFDPYFDFKEAMSKAKSALDTLAEDKTLVVVVDELDRCLPEYAIKVLERLHHLFSELDNSVVILAVDKEQLDNTVKQIFGPETATEEYLKKFISFHLPLDIGKVTSGFREKHQDYVSMFVEDMTKLTFDIDVFISALFAGIEIREQERLMERLKMAHITLFGNEPHDYLFMCVELMWLVFSQYYHATQTPLEYIASEGHFHVKTITHKVHNELCEYIAASDGGRHAWQVEKEAGDTSYIYYYYLMTPDDSFQSLILYFQQMFPHPHMVYVPNSKDCDRHQSYMDSFHALAQFLDILK